MGSLHSFDVYAPTFIPDGLRAVNFPPTGVLKTDPIYAINYEAYAASFIPPLFLHKRPVIDHLLQSHNANTHLACLYRCFRDEILALRTEIASRSLYKVPVAILNHQDGFKRGILHIPGLRENSPPIELEDVVSLRQLSGNQPSWQSGFTRVQFDARVDSIDRAEETVVLRINHCGYLSTLGSGFNVSFNSSLERIEAQGLSLALIQDLLNQTTSTSTNGSLIQSCRHTDDHEKQKCIECIDSGPRESQKNAWMRRMLFPENKDGALQTDLTHLAERQYFDDELNFEQQKAVDSVCQRNYGEVPFLIDGPPGTGKTKTIVSCLHLIYFSVLHSFPRDLPVWSKSTFISLFPSEARHPPPRIAIRPPISFCLLGVRPY